MSELLLLVAWLAPLSLLMLSQGPLAGKTAAIGALPAFVAALSVPIGTGVEVSWLMLGMTLQLDQTGSWFLLFSSLMWSFAGLYAAMTLRQDTGRFSIFFLLACAGNLLLILAADMVTFYVGFALMGLSATGLIAARRSQRGRRAARVYLIWTLVGELAIFTGIVLLAGEMASLRFADLDATRISNQAFTLLLLGFGIKLALPGLHFWLPLAYTTSPAAVAAVLSGPMISAGLLGWLRFLPPGTESGAAFGGFLIAAGVTGVGLGVLAGIVQRDPRAVLAYSSIAKMGLVAAVFGATLIQPAAAPAGLAALVVFAMHHLMLKGALFIGSAEWRRNGASPGLIAVSLVLALAMLGAPFTSGAGAKLLLDTAIADMGFDFSLLFGFSALGTLLLMARFLWLLTQRRAAPGASWQAASLVWLLLAATAILSPLMLLPIPLTANGLTLSVLALLLALGVALGRDRIMLRLPRIPPGDLLHLVSTARKFRSGSFRLQDLAPVNRAVGADVAARVAPRLSRTLILLLICVAILTTLLLPGRIG